MSNFWVPSIRPEPYKLLSTLETWKQTENTFREQSSSTSFTQIVEKQTHTGRESVDSWKTKIWTQNIQEEAPTARGEKAVPRWPAVLHRQV